MRMMILTGRLAADAEKKLGKNGKEYISFRMANNDYDYNNESKTYWYSVTNYENLALYPYLKKGKSVSVVGLYSDRIYQTREGNCEIGRNILAHSIDFYGDNAEKQANGTTTESSSMPTMQTSMQETKPKTTTAQLEVPKTNAPADDEDDLPF